MHTQILITHANTTTQCKHGRTTVRTTRKVMNSAAFCLESAGYTNNQDIQMNKKNLRSPTTLLTLNRLDSNRLVTFCGLRYLPHISVFACVVKQIVMYVIVSVFLYSCICLTCRVFELFFGQRTVHICFLKKAKLHQYI